MHVTWIYPEVNKPIGVGEATVPQVQRFLGRLGISVEDMILHCNANLKLGAKFENWSPTCDSFFHPFGGNDVACMSMEWFLKHEQLPLDILESYPENHGVENDDYPKFATNFDVRELCKYLDTIFVTFPNLSIQRRTITDASEIADDHIIDATGFAKTLINKGQPENFHSIEHLIPNNRAYVYRAEYSDKDKQQLVYTKITAAKYGWIWSNPLKDVITFGYVYDDKYDVKQEYIDFVEEALGYKIDQSKIQNIKMVTGRNIKHVRHQDNKTIYSIGLSSYFIEPIEATGLYLSSYGIELLDKLLDDQISEQQYNDEYNREFDAVCDFVLSFYKYAKHSNEYWDHYKTLDIEKHNRNSIFPPRSWNLILAGMGQEEKEYRLSAMEMLKICKGNVKYSEWLRHIHATNGQEA
jgi:tryptophan halogenase